MEIARERQDMAELLYRLGKWAARRAWWVIAGWVVILAIAGAVFGIGYRGLVNAFDIPGIPSTAVTDQLTEKLPDYAGAAGTIVFRTDDGSAMSDSERSAISAVASGVKGLPDVANVVDPFTAEQQRAAQQTQLDAAKAQLDSGQAQLDAGQQQLDAGRTQLEAAKQQLQADGMPTDQIDAQLAQLDASQQQLDASAKQLQDGEATYDQGKQLFDLASPIRTVSSDGAAAIVNVAFTEPLVELSDTSKQAVMDYVAAHPIDGVEVGISTVISQGVPSVIGVGEAVGLLIAIIVLGIMLRTFIGAAIPLVSALTGIGVGLMASLSLSGIIQMALATPVLGLMLGLAVGIDY